MTVFLSTQQAAVSAAHIVLSLLLNFLYVFSIRPISPCSGPDAIYNFALSVSEKMDSCSSVTVVLDQPNVITEEDTL